MLSCNKKTGKIEWAFDGAIIPTFEKVLADFQTSPYKHYYFLEKELTESINHLQQQSACSDSAPPPSQLLPVAEQRDAELSFELSKDAMSASINISAAYGGKSPDTSTIKKALAGAAITKGILVNVLQALPAQAQQLEEKQSLSQEIAKGKLPVKGKDAYLEFLTRSAKDRLLKPKKNEDGSVDMRDLGDPITVKPKQALALRHPPEPGIAGYDVTGKVIPPQAGKDIKFSAGEGSEIDPNNPNKLLATKEGLPLVSKDSVSVDDVMILKKVDVTTGHVRFSGSLLINGDVGEGMKVESEGDIHITGSVESAFVSAGGSITVNNGIIGHQQNDDSHKCSCELKAKKDITAQFAQYAQLESEQDIVLVKQSNHCQLAAKNKVIIGSLEKANGRLIGGTIVAEFGLEAGEIGAPSGAKTTIEMGTNYKKVKAQINALTENNIQKFEAMKLSAQRAKKSNEQGAPEMVLMALEEFKEYKALSQQAQLELDMAKEQVERILNETACISNQKLHARVSFSIGESSLLTSREHGPSIIHYVEGKLAVEPKA